MKRANMADWIEARFHQSFTGLLDGLLADGRVTRDERMALTVAVGRGLEAFHAELMLEPLAVLATRAPWDEPPGLADFVRSGRRLSAAQLDRLRDAQATLAELVRWAGYEEDGTDETGKGWPVKALGKGRIGGYAVLWGSPQQRDLTSEFFTSETAELTAIFEAMRAVPLLYQHAMDDKMVTTVVGPVDVMKLDGTGLWYEAQMTLAGEYRSMLEQLIEEGALGTSSGTLPGARRVNGKTGEIVRWPIAEVSLTPTPAEPRMMLRPVAEVKAAFAALGLDFAADKAIYAQDGEPGGAVEETGAAGLAELEIERERVGVLMAGLTI